MNALINLVTRASSTRKRDLIAPTVSKMTPKMTSKVTPKMTSGTPSGALWSNPSPEGLGKGPGSPNAYKTNKKPPPEPVGQEGRKARQWCSVERLRLPAFFDASFGSMLYVHINACNIFVIQMHWGIAINLQCACNGLVKVNKNYRSRVVMIILAKVQWIHKVSKCTLRRTRKFQIWWCYAARASFFSWFCRQLLQI